MESTPRGTVIGARIKQKSAEVGNGVMRDRRGKQMIDRIPCTYVYVVYNAYVLYTKKQKIITPISCWACLGVNESRREKHCMVHNVLLPMVTNRLLIRFTICCTQVSIYLYGGLWRLSSSTADTIILIEY